MKDNIKVGHINVRSLVPKIGSIRCFLESGQYSVLAITETWLPENVDNNLLDIKEYSIVRKYRVGQLGVRVFMCQIR